MIKNANGEGLAPGFTPEPHYPISHGNGGIDARKSTASYTHGLITIIRNYPNNMLVNYFY